jgi:hypothetical protein
VGEWMQLYGREGKSNILSDPTSTVPVFNKASNKRFYITEKLIIIHTCIISVTKMFFFCQYENVVTLYLYW